MTRSDLVEIRDGQADDINFVISTFLLGIYYGDTAFSYMKKDQFMKHYHQVIEDILASNDTWLRMACLKEDPSVLLGYALINKKNNALHFTFVKKPWRKIGIMKSLIPEEINACTHLTKVGVSLISKYPKIEFNPFLIT